MTPSLLHNLGYLPLVIAFVVNVVLAAVVYKNNPHSATNRLFGILGLIIAVWLPVLRLAQAPEFLPVALFLTRLSVFIATPMSLVLFLFAHTLPQPIMGFRPIIRWVMYGAMVIVMLICLSPYVFTRIDVVNGFPEPAIGPAFPIFIIFSNIFSAAALITLFWKLHKTIGREKEQLRYVAAGMLIMLILIIFTIPIPIFLFNNASFVPLVPLYTLIFLGMTAYAIVRHHLLDIRFVLARALSFSVVLTGVALLYAAAIILLIRIIPGAMVNSRALISALFLTVAAMLSFRPLDAWVRKHTDRLFFKGEYNSDALLKALTRLMSETLELETMTRRVLKTLTAQMKIAKAAFLFVDEHKITGVESIGYKKHEVRSPALDALFHRYGNGIAHVLIDEIQGPLQDVLRSLGCAAAFPIRVGDGEVAILVVGFKASGEVYAGRDIEFLDVFASEAGIAIQNAKSYVALKRFSEELEERVTARTGELRQANKKLAVANQRLQDLDHAKTEFLSVASHQLRTPLTALRSYTTLLLDGDYGAMPAKIRSVISDIAEYNEHLINLVGLYLDLSRIESGNEKYSVIEFSMLPLVQSVVKQLTPSARTSGVKIRVESAGFQRARTLAADEEKIRHVLLNIIDNSIKYAPQGSVTIAAKYDEYGITVRIKDEGIGFSQSEKINLFQKFYRTDSAARKVTEGSGVGLYIAKRFVEAHGGNVFAKSAGLGKGATFGFWLPWKIDGALAATHSVSPVPPRISPAPTRANPRSGSRELARTPAKSR